jgi:hypothetical protein
MLKSATAALKNGALGSSHRGDRVKAEESNPFKRLKPCEIIQKLSGCIS